MGLRPSVRKQVINSLRKDAFFTDADFTIDDSSESTHISYVHRSYWFRFELPDDPGQPEGLIGSRPNVISVFCAPGETRSTQSFNIRGLERLLRELREWQSRIKEDLLGEPFIRAVERNREALEQLSDQIGEIDDEAQFNRQEVVELSSRLDELRERMAQQFNEEIEDKARRDARLSRLEEEVAALKQQLTLLTKKGWFRGLASRIVSWGSKPEVQRLLLDAAGAAVKQLGDGHAGGPSAPEGDS
jgi:hypothetical protein